MRNISTTRAMLVASEIVIGLKSTRWCRRIGESPEADIGAEYGFKTQIIMRYSTTSKHALRWNTGVVHSCDTGEF